MLLDIHTQGKISAWTSITTAIGAFTLSQILGLISLVISIAAGAYSLYCSRKIARKTDLEIRELMRKEAEFEKIRHHKTGGKQ